MKEREAEKEKRAKEVAMGASASPAPTIASPAKKKGLKRSDSKPGAEKTEAEKVREYTLS